MTTAGHHPHSFWRPGFRAPLCATSVVCVFLIAVSLTGCAPRFGDSEAALALEDIWAGQGASRLKDQTPAPSRQTVAYRIEDRRHVADLYLSPEGARAGIVLVPGVAEAGKDDARLVALARTLARLRFAVLVPEIEGLRQYRVGSSDVRDVADAFRYLISRRELIPQGRAGLAGFSYGAGPVLLAGLRPEIRERVHFILTLGGYYDLHTVVRYFTTGYYRDGDRWRYRAPQSYAAWVFAASNAELLERPADRRRLRAYGRLVRDGVADEAAVPLSGLAPDAQALYDLLGNHDPERVPALIDRLSPRIRTELEGINPAGHDLSRLQAELILVHGRSDNIIPYTESVALARDLPPGQAQLFLIDGFAHVDIGLEEQDRPRMLDAMARLLAQRQPLPPEVR